MFRALPLMLLSLVACGNTSAPPLPPERTLYVNGRVWQGPDQADAEALAVEGGKVVAVGATQGLSAQRYTKRVDLAGRRVVPALIDAHSHPAQFAHPDWMANAPDWVERGEYGPTAEEGRAMLAAKLATLPPGTPAVLIVGINWYRTAPKDVRAFLDSISTSHPILAIDWGGHGHAVNSVLLAEAGYTDGMPDSETGRVSRDATGRLTGWVQEMMELPVFHALTNRLSDEYLAAALVQYGQGWAGFGGGSVYDINAFVAPSRMPAIRAAVAQATPVRFIPVDILTSSGPRPGPHDGRRIWKVFLDGAPGDCTALRLPQPPLQYLAPETCPYVFTSPWYGAPDVTHAFIVSALRDARAQGAHVLFHGLGEGAVENLLRALGEVGGGASWRGIITLEHGDMVTREQLQRLQGLGVPLVQNATHLVSVPGLTTARFDVHTIMDTELLASVRAAHVELAFGTDAFGFPTSPWLEMELAVTHPFHPAEAIRRQEFLAGYTHVAAAVRGQGPGARGLLEPGQPASFTVLNQDVLDEQGVPNAALSDTLAVLTVVNGEVAHTTGEVQ